MVGANPGSTAVTSWDCMYIVLSARVLNPKLYIVSRAVDALSARFDIVLRPAR